MPLSPEQEAQIAALVAANGVAYQRVEDRLVTAVQNLLRRLFGLGWFSGNRVDTVSREMQDLVDQAQRAVADLTQAYADAVLDALEVSIPRRTPNVRLPARLRAVDPVVEWQRPARDARIGLLLGLDEFEANEKALFRAEQQARMDLALARREAERQRWGVTEDVIGVRRVLRPELSQSGPCGLCIVASTRIYSAKELKPLHGGCVCGSLPVTRAADAANDMNRADFEIWSKRGEILEKIGLTKDDLDEYYRAAGGAGRAGLQRVRVRTLNHGELGPVLVDNKYKNRTAGQSKKLEDQKLDPERIYKIQAELVERFEKDLADGKLVSGKMLNFHRRMRDEWAQKLADQAA